MKPRYKLYGDGIYILSLALILMALILNACTTNPGAAPTGQPAAGSGSEGEPAGQGYVFDSYDEFVQVLEDAGADLEPAGEAQPGFFDLNSKVIKVNGADVQVMEFPDEASRQAASETISPDGTQIGTSIIRWIDTPHFWANGRLIVLYVGNDPAALNLLTQVLGATITTS